MRLPNPVLLGGSVVVVAQLSPRICRARMSRRRGVSGHPPVFRRLARGRPEAQT